MNRRMVQLADIVRQDKDVAAFGMNGDQAQFNTGRFYISLRSRKTAARTAPMR